MKYYKFRWWAVENSPVFKSDDWTEVNKLSWTLKAVYHNLAETKKKKDWTDFEVAENIKVILWEDVSLEISTSYWRIYRPFCNALLNAEIGDEIEISTYISKWFKTIAVTKPKKQWEKLAELYKWAIPFSEIPEIKTVKVKGKDVKDDFEANAFFWKLIDEKFPRVTNTSDEEKVISDEIGIEDIPF